MNNSRFRELGGTSWVLVAAGFALAGCGPDYGGRKEIKGTVTLKGAPIKEGTIDFMPIGEMTTKSGAMIKDGAYLIPAASGLVPGEYRVVISAGDGRTPASAPADAPPGPTGANIVSRDLVPPDYNVNSKQQVKVTEKGPNVFDFKIP